MERDRENLWSRRSNAGKLSIPVSDEGKGDPPRSFASRRLGGDSSSHGSKSNPLSSVSPASVASPGTGASSAFGLGSGAFASFGSANKTPKTPGTAFDWGKAAASGSASSAPGDKRPKGAMSATSAGPGGASKSNLQTPTTEDTKDAPVTKSFKESWPLKDSWVVWYRPPTSKNSDYEKSIKPLCRMETAQDFWKVYLHLKRPSDLPTVSDYHFFKEGIRPVWEDDMNKKGGKWIMRLKKGVANRYWENLLLAMVGDQFFEAGEEVCGAVLSVRSGEDVFSIWTKNDGGRNIKIRETIKRVLALPSDTNMQWKSHDDSIAQRTAIDQARQEKVGHHGSEKRRTTLSSIEDSPAGKGRS